MKVGNVSINEAYRMFIQEYIFDQEDGMPEGYTLRLYHSDKPEDPPSGTVYKDGGWGCWDQSIETLVLDSHEEFGGGITMEKAVTLDTPKALSWLDIYDGIILYSSTGDYRYDNFVLYNVKTGTKKIVKPNDYIEESHWDSNDFDHLHDPTLWIQDDIIYVYFEAIEGWYDGGESRGERMMCFKKDTLDQLNPEDCPLDRYAVEDAINENRGREYKYADGTVSRDATRNINLYPDSENKFGKETISTMCHETECGRHKYPEFPKKLIKQMKKLRLEYAKSIDAEIESNKIHRHSFWNWLYEFAGKVQHWAWKKHMKQSDRRSKKKKKKES